VPPISLLLAFSFAFTRFRNTQITLLCSFSPRLLTSIAFAPQSILLLLCFSTSLAFAALKSPCFARFLLNHFHYVKLLIGIVHKFLHAAIVWNATGLAWIDLESRCGSVELTYRSGFVWLYRDQRTDSYWARISTSVPHVQFHRFSLIHMEFPQMADERSERRCALIYFDSYRLCR
jgi:hypothetical protein